MAFPFLLPLMSTALGLFQAQQQQRAAQRAAQEQLNQKAKQEWAAFDKAEKERKKNLKRSLASRRARFAGRGLATADGSAGALIQRMRNDKAEQSFDDYEARRQGLENMQGSLTSSLMESADRNRRQQFTKIGQTALGLMEDEGFFSQKPKKQEEGLAPRS